MLLIITLQISSISDTIFVIQNKIPLFKKYYIGRKTKLWILSNTYQGINIEHVMKIQEMDPDFSE